MLSDYLPIGLLMLIAILVAVALVGLSHTLGPRGDNRWKREPFECGSEPVSSARGRFAIKYLLVAIMFIVFAIEAVFIIPWAVVYRRLGLPGLLEMLVFIGILAVGLLYVWRKGGLKWD